MSDLLTTDVTNPWISRWRQLRSRLPKAATPVFFIVLVVLAANILLILGITNNDPISWTANIARSNCGFVCGRSMIDINVGMITQPLGHLAANNLLHGHLSWWNSFEGLGQPLVGEMQSAALFPLVVLFALPTGLLWFHVALEIIAGVSTYFLARRLSIPVVIAGAAGMLFALNGTFAWLGNSVLNPVCFLPMLLLGVEMILSGASSRTRRGWYVAALALALSIYAGFPEVAYFDLLFVIVWAAVRLFAISAPDRLRALRRFALAGIVGIVLSLPALVPFGDFLKVAFVGGHVTSIDGSWHLSFRAFAMFFDPYVYGTIYQNSHVFTAWGEIGGYFGASVFALALFGVLGSRLRPLRIFLVLWTLAGMAGAFDIFRARVVWNLIPLVNTASVPRYIMPSCELAIVVLAVLGIADLATTEHSKRRLRIATVVMVFLVIWCVFQARSYNRGVGLLAHGRFFVIALNVLPFLALLLVLLFNELARAKWKPILIAVVVVSEAFVLFLAPTAQAPKQIQVDLAPIHYLQRHQGEDRFLDLGVLPANWGSEFGLNSLSVVDLPFPKSFETYIQAHLYPGLKPKDAFTIRSGSTNIDTLEFELATHFRAYENASVKYLLAPSSVSLSAGFASLGVRKVFHDSVATIYELPSPRPFFSSSSCSVSSRRVNQAVVHCSSGGSTLLRTELSMKGWTATVNGVRTPITTVDGVYQRVELPSGTSTVTFHFYPPYEHEAILLALLAALFFIASIVNERTSLLRRRRRADTNEHELAA